MAIVLRLLLLLTIGFSIGCNRENGTRLLPGEKYSVQDALSGIERGKPVVLGILQFEADTGIWPHDLSELVPGYLTAGEIKAWRYHTFHHDDFALAFLGPLNGGTLHYDRDPGEPGAWNVWWYEGERQHIDKLEVVQPQPSATNLLPEMRSVKRHAILRQRIQSMPDRIVFRIGLMKHYFNLGQFNESRAICIECIEKWPDYWWSYLMLAKIEAKLGDQSESERRLKGLAARWNDFFGYAFLAQFYFDRKESEKCKDALQQSLKSAPTRHKDLYSFEQIGGRQSWVADCYYHNAAYLAYRMGNRELCLEICKSWREFVNVVQHYGGVEEKVLRVVCAVNEADWDKASRLLQEMREPANFAQWQDAGINKLEGIVRERNSRYEYNPKLFRPAGAPLTIDFE